MTDRQTAEEYMEEESFDGWQFPSPSTYKFRVSCVIKTYNSLGMVMSSIHGSLKREFGLPDERITVWSVETKGKYRHDSKPGVVKGQVVVSVGRMTTQMEQNRLEEFVHIAMQEGASGISAVKTCHLIDVNP